MVYLGEKTPRSTKYVHIKSTPVYEGWPYPGKSHYNIWDTLRHKVRTYKEYHSVCPSSELGLPPPPHRPATVPPPPCFWGGGEHSLLRKGLGESQFRRGAYTVVLFICTYFVPWSISDIIMTFPGIRPTFMSKTPWIPRVNRGKWPKNLLKLWLL